MSSVKIALFQISGFNINKNVNTNINKIKKEKIKYKEFLILQFFIRSKIQLIAIYEIIATIKYVSILYRSSTNGQNIEEISGNKRKIATNDIVHEKISLFFRNIKTLGITNKSIEKKNGKLKNMPE